MCNQPAPKPSSSTNGTTKNAHLKRLRSYLHNFVHSQRPQYRALRLHMAGCARRDQCTVPNCYQTTKLLHHYLNCKKCKVCAVLSR